MYVVTSPKPRELYIVYNEGKPSNICLTTGKGHILAQYTVLAVLVVLDVGHDMVVMCMRALIMVGKGCYYNGISD